ncbi:MAG TPA: hypothetical protein DD729_09525, partial [Rhodobacteraceae bacterium]|nr:hypothetical protein [Paracoccaceae bacterium]
LENLYSLKDRVALVTGAAAGMGDAIATGLSRAGASVAVADRDEKDGRLWSKRSWPRAVRQNSSLWIWLTRPALKAPRRL